MLKKFLFLTVTAMMLVLSVGVASAGGIEDGRINSYDVAAPVAIYYSYGDGYVENEDGELEATEVITGIELWVVTSSGNGVKVLSATTAQIEKAVSAAKTDEVKIVSGSGFSINYNTDTEEFYVTGANYVFAWDDHYELVD